MYATIPTLVYANAHLLYMPSVLSVKGSFAGRNLEVVW